MSLSVYMGNVIDRWPLMLRRILSIGLWCGVACGLLFSLLTIAMPLSLDSTLQSSHTIETKFHRVSAFVDVYRRQNGQYPSIAEIERWSDRQGLGAYFVTVIDPSINDMQTCCDDAPKTLGIPPKGSYLLSIWRGEWNEYYAPWSGKSTLTFDKNDYAFSGNLYLDIAIACLSTIALAIAAISVWPRKPLSV